MSNSFKSIEQLNIDPKIAKEIFDRESEIISRKPNYEKSIDLYNKEDATWTFGFSQEIYRVITKYFRTDRDYKTALKYIREAIKIYEFQYNEFRHFFPPSAKIHKTSISRLSKMRHYSNFCYWIIDRKNIKKLVIDLIKNDKILEPEKYINNKGDEKSTAHKTLRYLGDLIRYFELDRLEYDKTEFLKLIKDNSQIFSEEKRLNDTISSISKSDSDMVDNVEILNVVLEKFFLKENQKTFINEKYLFSVHKNLFQFSHRIRSEVFDDITNLNYAKYVNNKKLRLLTYIKKIDYKSLFRRLKNLKKLEREDLTAYKEELSYLSETHLKSYLGVNLLFLKENSDYSYYKMLLSNNREKQLHHFQNILDTQREFSFLSEDNKPFLEEEMKSQKLNYSMAMNMANTYQYIGLTHPDLDEGYSYLKRCVGVFSSQGSKKVGSAIMYTNYVQSLIFLRDSKDPEDFVKKIKNIREEYLDPKDDKERMRFDMLPSVAKHIYNVIRISSHITRIDSESLEFLFNRMQSSNTSDSFVADRKELARLVMAYNLLSVSLPSSDSKVIFEAIQSFVIKGKAELLNLKQDEAVSPNQILYDDLLREEDKDLEFKGSWSLDIKAYVHHDDRNSKLNEITKSPDMIWEILKNVAAMQNTIGGKIYVGILESDDTSLTSNTKQWINGEEAIDYKNKLILGIDTELKLLKFNIDQYTREIEQNIISAIDSKSMEFIEIKSFIDIGDAEKTVICIEVEPRYDGAWYENKFYWRTNKSAIQKPSKDVREYLNNRETKYGEEKNLED